VQHFGVPPNHPARDNAECLASSSSPSAIVTHGPASGSARATRRRVRRSPSDTRNGRSRDRLRSATSPNARAFTPHASFKQMMDAEQQRYSEPPPDLQPTIDAVEAFLLAVFLRRYVTYCARRERFAAMNGAARLFDMLNVPARERSL
jgi:hypothetical protein